MNHNKARAGLPLRRRGVWLGLTIVLVGSLGLSSLTLGRDELAKPAREAARSSLAAAEMIIQGPDQAVVGQRFTLEVLIVNSGTTPLTGLEFVAQPDAHLEQESRARQHRAAVDPIAPDDLHIVRLSLTPRKHGAGGVDITLRAKNGETEQVRHVLPIVPAVPGTPQPERAQGASPLQFKITPLKGCFVDRPGTFLIRAVNTDSKAMDKKLDLVVSYMTLGEVNVAVPDPTVPQAGERMTGKMRGLRMPAVVGNNNPIRRIPLSLPVLGPGEARTMPIRLTPRRIGELQIAINQHHTVANPSTPAAPLLGSARLQVRFDPKTPIEQLLPVRAAAIPSRLPQKLAEVPEISLEDSPARGTPADEAFEHVAHLVEKINHVNTTKMDAYVEALSSRRSDLHGLPFAMGDACRLSKERGQHFLSELTTLRVAMGNPAALASHLPNPSAQPAGESAIQARIAALVQVLDPESTPMRQQMVKYLATLSHVDATGPWRSWPFSRKKTRCGARPSLPWPCAATRM